MLLWSGGRLDAVIIGDSLDVDNLVAGAVGIAGEILACQCADSQGYLRGALDLTTQLGSDLGQMDHQGGPPVPETAHAQIVAAVGGEVIGSAGSRQQASTDSSRRTATHSRQRIALPHPIIEYNRGYSILWSIRRRAMQLHTKNKQPQR